MRSGLGAEEGVPVKLWTFREYQRIQIQDFLFFPFFGRGRRGGGGGGQGLAEQGEVLVQEWVQ